MYPWIKALHLMFVVSWFAGLFYLPRIFVNLADEDNEVARTRLIAMSRRLLRFMTVLAVPAVALGLWLWLGMGIGLKGPGNGWMHAKLLLVFVIIGYHHSLGTLLRKFERGENRHTARWYRYFNEVPALVLLAIIILVVVKPF